MTEKKMDIESTLEQLEKIVTQMEEENLNLEDSLKSYEKGVSLVKKAQESLNKIEKKIQILSANNELIDLNQNE
ncbi:exodeoxyribonuclease VII small subunit [Methylophilaceae bacterium]|jgi:exodeoxyribonuclease VII small subunit|nr:exodeoxyribonuclease VII small subunit [Methylophilaceae bacterium]